MQHAPPPRPLSSGKCHWNEAHSGTQAKVPGGGCREATQRQGRRSPQPRPRGEGPGHLAGGSCGRGGVRGAPEQRPPPDAGQGASSQEGRKRSLSQRTCVTTGSLGRPGQTVLLSSGETWNLSRPAPPRASPARPFSVVPRVGSLQGKEDAPALSLKPSVLEGSQSWGLLAGKQGWP